MAVDPGREQPSWNETEEQPSVPIGIAITSFVLSLFFFVPFLNGITWLLALIFGHLALSNAGSRPSGKAATLAWIGLWITYVEIGYFLVGLAWSSVTEILPMMMLADNHDRGRNHASRRAFLKGPGERKKRKKKK